MCTTTPVSVWVLKVTCPSVHGDGRIGGARTGHLMYRCLGVNGQAHGQ